MCPFFSFSSFVLKPRLGRIANSSVLGYPPPLSLSKWHAVNIPDDQICWAMWKPVDRSGLSQEESFENVEFDHTEPVVKSFRSMPCPLGGLMGELVDTTSDDLRSQVYVESRLFDTWYHGRTVLLGDGKHNFALEGAFSNG